MILNQEEFYFDVIFYKEALQSLDLTKEKDDFI